MTYHEQLTTHLSAYRKVDLGLDECGVYKHKERSIPKEHILPIDQKWLNILPGIREQVKTHVERPPRIRLHRYFHHLNSSQAFTLNLFIPYFEGGSSASDALLRALGLNGSLSKWKLEEVPDAEEETNVDVSWQLTDGGRYLCEVKLSESDFGTAKNDEEHVRKLARTYEPVLRGQVENELLRSEQFCGNYQVLRLAWHAVKDKKALVFVLPRANRQLWQKLLNIMPVFTEKLRTRISMVAMEDVLARLIRDPELPPELNEHARALHKKYVLPVPAAL